MRFRNLISFIVSITALVSSITGLITAAKAKSDNSVVYQQAAEGVADNADELLQLKERLAKLEDKEIKINGN